jgi:ADP-heptose:LPS heptosyltransferase
MSPPKTTNGVTVSLAYHALRGQGKLDAARTLLNEQRRHTLYPDKPQRKYFPPLSAGGVGTEMDRQLREGGVHWDCEPRRIAVNCDEQGLEWCVQNRKTIIKELQANLHGLVWKAIDRARAGPRQLLLRSQLSPGDILTLTAAVKSLHDQYPGRYTIAVDTSAPEIWEHNPGVVPIPESKEHVTVIDMHYPLINGSSQQHVPFLLGYTAYLAQVLGIQLSLTVNRPQLYLSDEEKLWMDQVSQYCTAGTRVPFWLINAGVKSDYPTKQWPIEHYQEVVDRTRGWIQWVQIGQADHDHVRLQNVIDFVGRTTGRELIRLAYHCQGGLGPVTYLQHLCAAWEKPYVCLLGGREAVTWVQYPVQHTLHTIGQLPCCTPTACWKSRVVPLGDGDPKDQSLCERPVVSGTRPAPECMARIQPEEVISLLRRMAR